MTNHLAALMSVSCLAIAAQQTPAAGWTQLEHRTAWIYIGDLDKTGEWATQTHFEVERAASLRESVVPRRGDVIRLSHDDRFKVRLHHPLHAKPLGDSIQFIQLEAWLRHASVSASSATSRPILFLNRKQSATVLSDIVDMNGLRIDAMLPGTKVEHHRRDV